MARVALACLLVGAVPALGAHAPEPLPAGAMPAAHSASLGAQTAGREAPTATSALAGESRATLVETAASRVPAPRPGWAAPLRGVLTVVQGFAPPAEPWGAGHRGVDLAAAPGRLVRAAGAGVVLYAGPLAGRGVVSVQHEALRTTYEPVRPLVERGRHVRAGQPIGVLTGSGSHCPPAACLHWGLISDETYLDPLALLQQAPVRLLQVWGVPEPPTSP